jgi:hypothetical protein
VDLVETNIQAITADQFVEEDNSTSGGVRFFLDFKKYEETLANRSTFLDFVVKRSNQTF